MFLYCNNQFYIPVLKNKINYKYLAYILDKKGCNTKVILVMSIYNLKSSFHVKAQCLATFSESQSAFGYIFHHFYNEVTVSSLEVPR